MDIKGFIDHAGEVMEENSSSIFIGLGLAAFGLAVAAACVEAPKAKKVIDETKNDILDATDDYDEGELNEEDYKAIKKDLYFNCGKKLVRYYGPIVLLVASGTFCILNAHDIDTNKITGLTTAYQMSETSRKLYQEKVIQKLGEKKELEIRDDINRDKVKQKRSDEKAIPVLDTVKQTTLFFDPYSGRPFRCSVDKVDAAINKVNADMLHNMTQTVTLNDVYDELGLPRLKGDTKGWNVERGTFHRRPNSGLTEDGQPCLVLDYDIEPDWDYYIHPIGSSSYHHDW